MNKDKGIPSTKNSTQYSRREWMAKMSMAPIASLLPGKFIRKAEETTKAEITLPCKDLFEVRGTFLNAAYTHPMSKNTARAAKSYIDRRLDNDHAADDAMGVNRQEAANLFAKLINAKPDDLAWIPSTMVGENFVVAGLGLSGSANRVITDAYHFFGSLYFYGTLASQGLDVHIIKPHENRIDLNDLETALGTKTRLVSISLVSTINGFQHDLKSVCDLAHAKGAMVFADIIQGAGAVPIDVQASGVDFCACSGYKWLMADFGAGFLYVRPDRMEQLKRSQFGYRQIASFTSHVYPFDAPGQTPFEWTAYQNAGGYFQVGTLSNSTIAVLRDSLEFITTIGVEKIQQYRQPLIDKLQQELPKYGYAPMTPTDSHSPIVSFALKDAATRLGPRLEASGINIQLYPNRFRISPSVYNDMKDIDTLIDVLSR